MKNNSIAPLAATSTQAPAISNVSLNWRAERSDNRRVAATRVDRASRPRAA